MLDDCERPTPDGGDVAIKQPLERSECMLMPYVVMCRILGILVLDRTVASDIP